MDYVHKVKLRKMGWNNKEILLKINTKKKNVGKKVMDEKSHEKNHNIVI